MPTLTSFVFNAPIPQNATERVFCCSSAECSATQGVTDARSDRFLRIDRPRSDNVYQILCSSKLENVNKVNAKPSQPRI